MNRRLIIRVLGALLCIEAIAMLPATVLSFYFRDGDFAAMGCSLLLTLIPGLCMWLLPRVDRGVHLRLKEGFIIVALGWLILSFCGSLPYLFSETLPSFFDAFFESVSGFTTTGASVVTRFEGFPRGVMFWRVTTHWIGGMGVLVLTLALLPKLTGRTSHLVLAESPGPSLSKLVPKTGQSAKILYCLYIALTVSEFIVLLLCGLSPYDAALHSFSTAGTGGFSNYGASIAAFDNLAVEIAISVFMFLFGVNFALYYRFLIGDRLKAFWKDEEFRWYFVLCLVFILLVTVFNLPYYGSFFTSLRYGSFEILTTMSTTGFVIADFTQWPVASHLVILLAMFIGSCAGSTAGGIKVIRINMLLKLSRRTIRATSQPKKVEVVRIDGKAVPENTLAQVSLFALMYGMLVLLGAFLLSLGGKYDMITHLTASLTCVSNVGPGFGAVGPVNNFAGYGPYEKMVASFLMLFGRLELLPMFFLFTRSAWHKY